MNSLLHSTGTAATLAIFAIAALAVWISGTALSRYADAIAIQTGLGKAFTGVLLLGAATSLPELATTISASSQGYPSLAGTNLLGSIAFQIVVLAFVDGLMLRNRALTHFSATPTFLMQAVLLTLLLALTAAAISAGELWSIGPVGLWSLILAVAYVLTLLVIYHYEGTGRWQAVASSNSKDEEARVAGRDEKNEESSSLAGLVGKFSIAATAVLISGWTVATSGARLTEVTGLDQTLVGASLVAIATSLPEVSTTVAAVRMGSYAMAVGNIFGTNTLNLALFLPADLAYTEGTVIGALDGRAIFLTALGIVLTSIYLWGLLERRDRTIVGFGVDSAAVILAYAVGMLLLYTLG